MKNEGVTLIELLVVVSIIGILAAALGFSHAGWVGRYKVESAVKGLYSDMLDARTRAMRKEIRYFVDFPSTRSYRVTEDTKDDGSMEAGAGDTVLSSFPKDIGYTVNGAVPVTCGPRGLLYSGAAGTPISSDTPVIISLSSSGDPDYDCINISETEIGLGRTDGGNCIEK